MIRTFGFLGLAILSFYFISCAPASTVQQDESSAVESHPPWFQDRPMVSTDTLLYGYGTALGSDSIATAKKAAARAAGNLRTALSEKLENIRREAAEELDSGTRVDSPEFILALRKAERVVSEAASIAQSEVGQVDGYRGYRGFAAVTLSRDELLERIGSRLSDHTNTWDALLSSRAFDEF